MVDGSRTHSRAGSSPYYGTVVSGGSREVLRRGELVVSAGHVLPGAGLGLLLRRGPAASR